MRHLLCASGAQLQVDDSCLYLGANGSGYSRIHSRLVDRDLRSTGVTQRQTKLLCGRYTQVQVHAGRVILNLLMSVKRAAT